MLNFKSFKKIAENVEISNAWLHNIKVKDRFSETPTDKETISIAKYLKMRLERIKKIHEERSIIKDEDDRDYIIGQLEEVIDGFEHVADLHENIKEKEWDNYGFDGNFTELFNEYMSMLYDLGDQRVIVNPNTSKKFIWID